MEYLEPRSFPLAVSESAFITMRYSALTLLIVWIVQAYDFYSNVSESLSQENEQTKRVKQVNKNHIRKQPV